MSSISRKDRAMGAILGALIGDALGVGPHWYYDLNELQADYGDWISDYLPPRPGRYHAGVDRGDVSQTGQICLLLLESLAVRGGYDRQDVIARLDALLATLDGTPQGGRYTDAAMRDVWHGRQAGRPWGDVGSFADTAEAAIRAPLLAAACAGAPERSLPVLLSDIELTHRDPFIVGQSAAFGLVVLALIRGVHLAEVSTTVPRWSREYGLSFSTAITWRGEGSGALVASQALFFDALQQPGWAWVAAHDRFVRIDPVSRACRLFGLACSLGFMLPAAYYLAARYPQDFEMAVLSAINGGGNNMARAALTGAVSGAMVGLGGIPERFIVGLLGHERFLAWAEAVAEQAGA